MQIIEFSNKIGKCGSHGDKMETGFRKSSHPSKNKEEFDLNAVAGGSQFKREEMSLQLIEYPLPAWLGTSLRVVK